MPVNPIHEALLEGNVATVCEAVAEALSHPTEDSENSVPTLLWLLECNEQLEPLRAYLSRSPSATIFKTWLTPTFPAKALETLPASGAWELVLSEAEKAAVCKSLVELGSSARHFFDGLGEASSQEVGLGLGATFLRTGVSARSVASAASLSRFGYKIISSMVQADPSSAKVSLSLREHRS